MPLATLTGDERLAARDGSAVVVIPLYGQQELFARCLTSVLAHTPLDVPILVADDASPDPSSRAWVEALDEGGRLGHAVHWARAEVNEGFVHTCNRAFALCSRADVVLVNSDCVVAEGWLDGLRDAAGADGSIATATALTNHGSIVSVPFRNSPVASLPLDTTLEVAARAVRRESQRLRPRLPTAIGHCVLIRRAALDLVGGFDEAFAPGYGEEVDFSQRCIAAGLQHVLADDVLVLHLGGGTFRVGGGEEQRSATQLQHEEIIDNRYPAYATAVRQAESGTATPLARSLAIASSAILGPSVTVDVRCLRDHLTGTQVHALELVHALWRSRAVRLRLLVPDEPGAYATPILAAMDGVETLRDRDVTPATRRDPIVHRPYQTSHIRDLSLLEQLGERLVVTHQDLISYRNAHYFDGPEEWVEFRELTAETLATASLTLFFSRHAADDALAEELVPAERARVVPLGVDHQLTALQVAPRTPAWADRVDDEPFLLCLGTDFKHKNRLFALKLVEALQLHHGWRGRIVFCGPPVARGSSAGLEAEWLASRPQVAERVLVLAAVDEGEKRWLLERTAAVLYPTTYEGFGLVPFEAAATGVPCVFAPVSSLAEVLPRDTATIVPWEPLPSAARVAPLLVAGSARDEHVAALRAAAERLTWASAATATLQAYHDALTMPDRDLARIGEHRIPDARYWALRSEIGGTGMSLVAPDTPLLPEEPQRALAALARRPASRRPLLSTLRLLSRLGGGGD